MNPFLSSMEINMKRVEKDNTIDWLKYFNFSINVLTHFTERELKSIQIQLKMFFNQTSAQKTVPLII